MKNDLKMTLQHFSIRSTQTLDAWVEHQILGLRSELRIDEANVRLARYPDASPAYEVKVHLVTPGPDVFAESRDHTLRAAFAKTMRELRARIAGRTTRGESKLKSRLSAPAAKTRPRPARR